MHLGLRTAGALEMPTARAKFDAGAKTYEHSALQSLLFEPVHRLVLQHAARQVPWSARVLDAECGTGRAGGRGTRQRSGSGRSGRAEQLPPEHETVLPSISRPPDVAGATGACATYCALWMRSHDDDQSVVGGSDLLQELLTSTPWRMT